MEPVGTQTLVERRREERIPLLGADVLMTVPRPETPALLHGITVDISSSGMAVYAQHRLIEGMRMFVRADGILPEERSATVRWCTEVDDGVFKAGLMFS